MAKLSSKRIEEAISALQETLESFCETVLPGGHRSGDKWICGDLQDGQGKSCAVFLETGGFNDTNPAADHIKGGPIDLWKAIFGVSTMTEVVEGMEAWVEDGTLPDGAQGVVRKNEVTVSDEEEPIVARDKFELQKIEDIRCFKSWIKGTPGLPQPTKEKIAEYERQIAKRLSDIYGHRWQEVVEDTISVREDAAKKLAEYRGLSTDVFLWLIDNGYIAWYQPAEEWKDMQIAFPVFLEVQWLPGWATNDIAFLGMHLRWFGAGKDGWRYEPKGTPAIPLVIGDLSTADLVVIGESTWDVIAFIDLRKLHERGPDKPWAAIATRGAGNSARIPDGIKSNATVVVLMQNDAANEKWYERLPKTISTTARRIVPPTGTKDLNDWIRAAGIDGVNKELTK